MAQPRAQAFVQPKPDHTYSIVVYPSGDKAKALQASIDELAKKYGGTKVNAHLTLMGGIVDDQAGAEDRAKLLASQLKPQKVFFDKVVSRPVTIYGKPVHSVAVSVDGEIGFGEYGALAHPTYVRTPMLPRVAHLHVSLLYTTQIDEETLHGIVDEQQEKLLGADGLLHPAEYSITELALVETTNDDPTKWQVLGRYKLTGKEPEENDDAGAGPST
mmetsp:Transcript_20722/g.62437  ORF Transcript_20722/g.62437 Transcript_20722/m.62437 type:complete len:216 (-) Transcript_20722:787-1434(-)